MGTIPGYGRDQRRAVIDAGTAAHGRVDRLGIPQIAIGSVNVKSRQGPVVAALPHQDADFVSVGQQAAYEIGAEMAGRSGD